MGKKIVKIVELQQFESLRVKCHVLNIGSQSTNVWIVQRGKIYFLLNDIKFLDTKNTFVRNKSYLFGKKKKIKKHFFDFIKKWPKLI